jgi:hypothetical protein
MIICWRRRTLVLETGIRPYRNQFQRQITDCAAFAWSVTTPEAQRIILQSFEVPRSVEHVEVFTNSYTGQRQAR